MSGCSLTVKCLPWKQEYVGANPTTQTKICTTCKEPKDLDQFHKNLKKGSGLQPVCIPCRKIYDANYFRRKSEEDPSYRRLRVAAKKQAVEKARQCIYEYLLEHPCVDCGESDTVVLQFDHIDRLKKSFNIGNAVGAGLLVDKIAEEISKCQVRCANCHIRRTAKQMNWVKAKLLV